MVIRPIHPLRQTSPPHCGFVRCHFSLALRPTVLPNLRSENAKESRPRFEYYPPNSPELRTVAVERLPFTIGRVEGADLQINSTSVSREHARLVRTASGYRLKDLGSTNGTSVNGQEISDAVLVDGDSVTIADVELTFACSSMGRLQRIVTQPLRTKRLPVNRPGIDEFTMSVRSFNEALLWQAIPLAWTSLADRTQPNGVIAFASIAEPMASQMSNFVAADACTAIYGLQQSAWRLSVEQAADATSINQVMLRIEHSAADGRLIQEVDLALGALQGACRTGMVIPWRAFNDSTASPRVCAELRSRGLKIAIDNFSGGEQCVDSLEPAPPDYIVLDRQFAQGVLTHPRRMQQLEIVHAACETHGVSVVLPDALPPEVYRVCEGLGLDVRLNAFDPVAGSIAQPRALALA